MKNKRKILLIDQHPEWLKLADGVLSKDYEIVTLSNNKDILSLQAKPGRMESFDLIFIGLELATNNLDVLKPLFKQWHFVVIFPVLQENETVRLLFKAGVYDCAPKPYEREGLQKLVADELAVAKMANGNSKIRPLRKTRQEIAKQLSYMLNLED
jgi:DNA-binding NtrC family response regulator